MATIAIIGAGFSGVMATVHLLALARQGAAGLAGGVGDPLRVVLIERAAREVGGVAYGTVCPHHVLNVPAGRMSAYDDDPSHFLRWLKGRDASAHGGLFVQRGAYGAYLADMLRDAVEGARAFATVQRIGAEAMGVRMLPAGGVEVALRAGAPGAGRAIVADAAVISGGNHAPDDPPVRTGADFYLSDRYARDPWAPGALDFPRSEPVLLIGAGLTMFDVALALRAGGHTGAMHAVSRRGLLPQPHRVSVTPPAHLSRPTSVDSWERTALGYLKGLRAEVRRAEKHRVDWREVVTSLRADTPTLWRELPLEEKRRFLARLRTFWDTHRHRAAPQAAGAIADMIGEHELTIHAASLRGWQEDDAGVTALLSPRRAGGSTPAELRVSRVINCTGPSSDVRRVKDALVRSLVGSGLARPDELALGFDCDDDGRLIDASGHAHDALWSVGPLRKGRTWEATAVPELRTQARRTALALAQSLAVRSSLAGAA